MLSLSDNEFSVISFLVRNFTERLTIRNIAQRLEFSPAGVFNILKKLEKENIVTGQKLGTGLFYSMNFENRIAERLAAIVLLYSDKSEKVSDEHLKQAKAAIFDKKNLLLIKEVSIVESSIPGVNVMVKTEEEFSLLLKNRDAEILQLLRKGTVLFGEDRIIAIIKENAPRL